jgi:hypothetical protein
MTIERYQELVNNPRVIRLSALNSTIFQIKGCKLVFRFSYFHDSAIFKDNHSSPTRFSFNEYIGSMADVEYTIDEESLLMFNSERQLYAFAYMFKVLREENLIRAEILDKPEMANENILASDESITLEIDFN